MVCPVAGKANLKIAIQSKRSFGSLTKTSG
jgi:hypothetical protein